MSLEEYSFPFMLTSESGTVNRTRLRGCGSLSASIWAFSIFSKMSYTSSGGCRRMSLMPYCLQRRW